MLDFLFSQVLDTEPHHVMAAALVCVMTAATLVMLMRHTDKATPQQRAYSAAWIAVVAGMGVWTTHFVAMVGYRPDALLSYDLHITSISIAVGIVFVGLPLAASQYLHGTFHRLGLGIAAGLGVTAMHLTGMTALENCLPTYDPVVLIGAIIVSMACFGWALLQSRMSLSGLSKTALGIAGGVCGLHFIAMASVSLEQLSTGSTGLEGPSFSIMVYLCAVALFSTAFFGTSGHRKALANRQIAHSETFPPAQRMVRSLRY